MNFWNPGNLMFLGGLITLVAGVWQCNLQSRFENDLREKNERIASLNEENVKLSHQIASSVTGGESYCYVRLGSDLDTLDRKDTVQKLVLVHYGQYPVYDLNVHIQKSDKQTEPPAHPYVIEPIDRPIRIVKPRTNLSLVDIPMPDADSLNLDIKLSARNGLVIQTLRLRRINNFWLAASRIQKKNLDGSTIELDKKIDLGYPRNLQGEVDWL